MNHALFNLLITEKWELYRCLCFKSIITLEQIFMSHCFKYLYSLACRQYLYV